MNCPACSSSHVHHSRARSLRDQIIKRALPVTFYRCHDCGWRRFRPVTGWTSLGAYALSLIGYAAAVGLALAIIAGLLVIILALLGIAVPWPH